MCVLVFVQGPTEGGVSIAIAGTSLGSTGNVYIGGRVCVATQHLDSQVICTLPVLLWPCLRLCACVLSLQLSRVSAMLHSDVVTDVSACQVGRLTAKVNITVSGQW